MARYKPLYDCLKSDELGLHVVDDFPEDETTFLEVLLPDIMHFCYALDRLITLGTSIEARLRLPVDTLLS